MDWQQEQWRQRPPAHVQTGGRKAQMEKTRKLIPSKEKETKRHLGTCAEVALVDKVDPLRPEGASTQSLVFIWTHSGVHSLDIWGHLLCARLCARSLGGTMENQVDVATALIQILVLAGKEP